MAGSKSNSPVQILLAGGAAGGIESLVTYPTEYIKTQQQLLKSSAGSPNLSAIKLFLNTVRNDGVRQLYRGAGAFCLSNASKSAVRFFTFDAVRNLIRKDGHIKSSMSQNMLAGCFAGIAEGVSVVTPGETIKTRIISDQNRVGGPQYKSTTAAVRSLIRTNGIASLWTGVVPVTLKQSSNAVVRFTSYNMLLDLGKSLVDAKYRAITTMVSGGLAGIITVYCTMPMDNVKTRLQAIGGKERYSGSLNCAISMIREDGIKSLWRGTTPRLARLTVCEILYYHLRA